MKKWITNVQKKEAEEEKKMLKGSEDGGGGGGGGEMALLLGWWSQFGMQNNWLRMKAAPCQSQCFIVGLANNRAKGETE